MMNVTHKVHKKKKTTQYPKKEKKKTKMDRITE